MTRWWQYRRVHYDPQSFLRDEAGQIHGPGAALDQQERYAQKAGGVETEWMAAAAAGGEAAQPVRLHALGDAE